jgi:glutathione peroxidase-family protein
MRLIHVATIVAGLAAAGLAFGTAFGAPDEAKGKDAKKAEAAEAGEKKAEGEKAEAEEGLAPDFKLKDTHDKEHELSAYRGKWVVLEWIHHGCPFVKKHYNEGHMQALQEKYTGKDVVWLSICSSAPGKQGHMDNEKWNETIEAKKSKATAVLVDEDGKVGKLYKAKVTPHMAVISPKGKIVYEGAIDSIRSADPDDCEVADNYVAQVLDQGLAGKEITVESTDAYG